MVTSAARDRRRAPPSSGPARRRRPRRRARAGRRPSSRCAAARAPAALRGARRHPRRTRAPAEQQSRRRTGSRRRRRSTTVPPRTRPVPRTVKGSVPRAPSSTPTPSARSASSTGPTSAGSARAGRRRRRPRPWPAPRRVARTASRSRPDRSRPARRAAGPGRPASRRSDGDRRSRPSVRQRRGHQLGVARAQRPAYDGRPVGQRGEHECPVGQRLRAGQRDAGVHRGARQRCRPQGRRRLGTGLHAPEANDYEPRTSRPVSPRAWPHGSGAWPGADAAAAPWRARQATPGPALGVDRGEQQAAEHRDVLEEVDLLVGPRGRVARSRTGARLRSWASATSRARRWTSGARGRLPARAAAATCATPLMRTRFSASFGSFSLGDRLLEHRPDPVGHRLGLVGQAGGVLQRVDATHDEHRGQHGSGHNRVAVMPLVYPILVRQPAAAGDQ